MTYWQNQKSTKTTTTIIIIGISILLIVIIGWTMIPGTTTNLYNNIIPKQYYDIIVSFRMQTHRHHPKIVKDNIATSKITSSSSSFQIEWTKSNSSSTHLSATNHHFDKIQQQQQNQVRILNDEQNENEDNAANENDDADNNGNDDGNNNNDDDDDGAEAAADNQEQQGGDDFFDDYLQDDLVTDDDTTQTQVIDDFYVFERDLTPRLRPVEPRTVVAFLVIAVALSLGAVSGTGGGGIIAPIYIIILSLPIQVAIPIGAVTVLGGSIASTSINWTRRHPLADRVLIDWDLILVMEPLTLAGALVGTLFHRMLSEKLLVVLLVLLLSMTAHTTLSKASRMYMAEIRYIRHLRTGGGISPTMSPNSIQSQGTFDPAVSEPRSDKYTSANLKMSDSGRNKLDDVEKEEILILNPDFVTLRSELMQQEKFTPRSKIIAVCLIVAVITFLNVMVGGGSYNSPWDIVCGSVAFWVVHVIMVAFLIASAWAAQTYVVARHEIKELVRFDYVHGDIKWDARSAIIYPAVFVTAGLFAGTLGIGGGVITVPIMLAMGVHPGVVSATSSCMILFTSFASVTAFWIFGLILLDFAVVAFFVGFFSTLIGQLIHRKARQARSASGRDFERNSYTAFAIGGVVLVSALLMTLEYVFTIIEGPNLEKGGMCDGLRF